MELTVICPDYELIKTVAWLEINTPKGNYIIQHGHAPFIIPLSPNTPLTYQLESGKKETIVVKSGIADVNRTNITIIMRLATEQ